MGTGVPGGFSWAGLGHFAPILPFAKDPHQTRQNSCSVLGTGVGEALGCEQSSSPGGGSLLQISFYQLLCGWVQLGSQPQSIWRYPSPEKKNNKTTEPSRRIRRAGGWIGDFLWPIINTAGAQWWGLCQCSQRKMSSVFPILKVTLGHLLVFLLQRALGWVMKPVLLHKSNWLQTSQCSSPEQAVSVLFKRTLCFSMIFKSCLTDDLLTQPSNPLVSILSLHEFLKIFPTPNYRNLCLIFLHIWSFIFFVTVESKAGITFWNS